MRHPVPLTDCRCFESDPPEPPPEAKQKREQALAARGRRREPGQPEDPEGEEGTETGGGSASTRAQQHPRFQDVVRLHGEALGWLPRSPTQMGDQLWGLPC